MNYIEGLQLREMPEASSYLNHLAFVEYLSQREFLSFEKPVTFFVGENGTGKSTLIEAIATEMGFNGEGGSKDHNFSTRDTCSAPMTVSFKNEKNRPEPGILRTDL